VTTPRLAVFSQFLINVSLTSSCTSFPRTNYAERQVMGVCSDSGGKPGQIDLKYRVGRIPKPTNLGGSL